MLVVLPDDLKPSQNGVPMQVKPYKAYVPQVSSLVFYFWLVGPIIQLHNNNWDDGFLATYQAGDGNEGLGIDYEYVQALSSVRVDLSMEE